MAGDPLQTETHSCRRHAVLPDVDHHDFASRLLLEMKENPEGWKQVEIFPDAKTLLLFLWAFALRGCHGESASSSSSSTLTAPSFMSSFSLSTKLFFTAKSFNEGIDSTAWTGRESINI